MLTQPAGTGGIPEGFGTARAVRVGSPGSAFEGLLRKWCEVLALGHGASRLGGGLSGSWEATNVHL